MEYIVDSTYFKLTENILDYGIDKANSDVIYPPINHFSTITFFDGKFYNLSKNTIQELYSVIIQTKIESEKDYRQFVKLRDNTIKTLVNCGVKDLPMLERIGHVRENILTEEQALKLGYSIKNKHYHGLGLKNYLEIINSMDNPLAIYQYTNQGKYSSDNFIIVTPIEINGKKTIVPVEINQKGQYNRVEINYNKIKSAYCESKENYLQKNAKRR